MNAILDLIKKYQVQRIKTQDKNNIFLDTCVLIPKIFEIDTP